MILKEIIEHLELGEIKQTGLSDFDLHQVQPTNYRELVQHINLGMMQLYTKFPVLEKELILHTHDLRKLYPLKSEHAYTSNNSSWWILDSEMNPFEDDVLRIESMWNSEGKELPINDEFDELSVFLPTPDAIQIPWAAGFEIFSVIYRAKPKKITLPLDNADLDLNQEVILPDYLLEPLLSYVEYRVRRSQNGESSAQLAMLAKQNYEMLCGEITQRNLLHSSDVSTCIKPKLNGWI